MDTFLQSFITNSPGDGWRDERNTKLRQVLAIYNCFADLAQDLRSKTYDADRCESFSTRVEVFVTKLFYNGLSACSVKMPYLHILRNHVGDFMQLYGQLFGWGYGFFSTNAGEHLNKVIKQYESSSTNLDERRFERVIRILRIQQFEYAENLFKKTRDIICSKCNQSGHNKKNRSCPLHETHPRIEFNESDSDE